MTTSFRLSDGLDFSDLKEWEVRTQETLTAEYMFRNLDLLLFCVALLCPRFRSICSAAFGVQSLFDEERHKDCHPLQTVRTLFDSVAGCNQMAY